MGDWKHCGSGTTPHVFLFWIWLPFLLARPPLPSSSSALGELQTPTPWPHQFHSILYVNYSGSLSLIDLWYDWPNGRNFNIIRDQLDVLYYDVEWNNGTVFKYYLDNEKRSCRSFQVEVGILRPNWLDGANYLGQSYFDGFLCNVWEKVDFIWYYEDVATKRPVHWIFYTGRSIHVMSFEVGAVLEDSKWQAPVYCFHQNNNKDGGGGETSSNHFVALGDSLYHHSAQIWEHRSSS